MSATVQKLENLTDSQRKRLSAIVAAANKLGMKSIKVRVNGKPHTIYIHSGNIYSNTIPAYLKEKVINVGK